VPVGCVAGVQVERAQAGQPRQASQRAVAHPGVRQVQLPQRRGPRQVRDACAQPKLGCETLCVSLYYLTVAVLSTGCFPRSTAKGRLQRRLGTRPGASFS
jgi:hypothetical protein